MERYHYDIGLNRKIDQVYISIFITILYTIRSLTHLAKVKPSTRYHKFQLDNNVKT